jgi:hypothetical protein
MNFKFVRPHNHAGREYRTGDTIDLPESVATRLQGLGAGLIVHVPAAKAKRSGTGSKPRKTTEKEETPWQP